MSPHKVRGRITVRLGPRAMVTARRIAGPLPPGWEIGALVAVGGCEGALARGPDGSAYVLRRLPPQKLDAAMRQEGDNE